MKLARRWLAQCLGKKHRSCLNKMCLFLESKTIVYPNNKSVKSTRGNPLKIHRLATRLDQGRDQIGASQDGVSKISNPKAQCIPTPKQFIRISNSHTPKSNKPFNRNNDSPLLYQILHPLTNLSNLAIIYHNSRIRLLRCLQSPPYF